MKKKFEKSTQAEGKFIGNERGFGFVWRKEGDDIFIPPHATFGALHGDEVICKIDPRRDAENPAGGHKVSGRIIEITARAPMVGTYFTEGNKHYVKSSEKKIPYAFEVPFKSVSRFGLADGHRVVFSIEKKHGHCLITEVLGHKNDPGVDVLTLVRQAGVPYEFSEEVADELQKISTEISESDCEGRLDLRDQHIFTIDGDDTKDIDDAISFDQNDKGYHLGVHIADVTHYVRENTAINASALHRGTSIYLADRVIPMLPHKLSGGICSLFPDVDRLTLSCLMEVDKKGNVTSHKITTSVIRSKKRYTYNEVQELLDGGTDDLINDMNKLREILSKKRQKRGALDFDLPEAKIKVDETGKAIAIERYPRNNATGIIEEFMILCNETIATHFLGQKVPFVYRSHEEPSNEKLAALQKMAENMRLMNKGKKMLRPTAATLQQFLDAVKTTHGAYAISTAVLQALPQANYTPDNPTHFGLASDAYCHFTSPIRRYADLQIHRIIKTPPDNREKFNEILPAVCAQASKAERTAEALEREVTELKKAQFMVGKEGKIFEATVSGLTPWGVYVMLENTIEGLIPTANLQKIGYKYNKELSLYEAKRRKGEKQAKALHHGSQITVKLLEVNEDERKLTFALHF
ncbi:MAG: ribonuclease R [Defluviitaleaceae bacterium]|nr:ribonuclease R [Defluviitaleaceae bacterium]